MKTTKKHFEIFKKECRYWIKRLGLTDYDVRFHHDWIEGTPVAKTSYYTTDQRIIDVTLTTNYGGATPLNKILTRIAFHEVCHILLRRYDNLANNRFVGVEAIDEENHALITRLQNAFFEDAS